MKRLAWILAAGACFAQQTVVVYREAGRFGGWPANHGIWSWGNEIVVGFSAAWYAKQDANRHQYDNKRPEEPRLARSLDGGATWSIEAPRTLLPPEQGGAAVTGLNEPMNFRDPNFAMTFRLTDINKGESRFWFTYDRGRTWRGPYRLPLFGQPGIAARTDYIVIGKYEAIVFLTASKSNGREGRVMCVRTTDGGQTWQFLAWIGDEPPGFSIMPASVRLSRNTLLAATRVKEEGDRNFIDLYRSQDRGKTWTMLAPHLTPTGAHSGNPPSLIQLKDGRLCLTYGYRSEPYGIRARFSRDEGETWGNEVMVRSGAAAWDLGYVRSVQRPDGKVVSLYYWNDGPHNERFIEATIWSPNP